MLDKSKPFYIGDGAYVTFDGFQIRLFTSNGINETNEVFLEPSTAINLQKYIDLCFKEEETTSG